MRPKLFTFFLAIAASAGTMFASNTQVDGIWYDFDYNNKTATVTYKGSVYNSFDNEYIEDVTIPASVIYNNKTYAVTTIGMNAFCGCRRLISISIPNSVTRISSSAFENCERLTSVTIPNGVTCIAASLFCGCTSLTSVTIPNSVTSIEAGAFTACNALTSITIPNSVTSIGPKAFMGCWHLKSIVIPSGVKVISYSTFDGCDHLTKVTIPNTVTDIEEDAFLNCSSLISVTIPNSVTKIGDRAFQLCSGLKSVTIGNSVTNIGTQAFCECTGLTSITCEALVPPALGSSVFADVKGAIPLYVHAESVKKYKVASSQWTKFKIIAIDSATKVDDAEVSATPTEDGSVILEWPAVTGADTYTITITKNGVVICTIKFDADGRFISISSATPARASNGRNVPAAEQIVKGWRYELKGLEENTQYTYNVTAKNGNVVLSSTTINFTTTVERGIEEVSSSIQSDIQKIVRNGQVFILRGDRTYTLTGQEVK